MADVNLDEELEKFKKISEVYRHTIEKNIATELGKGKSEAEAKKTALDFAKNMESANKMFKRSYDQIDASLKGLKEKFKSGGMSADDLEESLASLRKEVNNTADKEKKAALIAEKAMLEEANARNKSSEIFKNSMGTLAGTVLKGVASSFTRSATAALSGGDALSVASEFMKANIDTANSATQVGAKALGDFGAATAGAGGKMGKFGIAASVAGAALGFLSNTVSELAKAGISFMLTQTQKLIGGFQTMSASGAMFAGGMKEMIRTANSAGLTLEQFSKAVGENKDALSQLGMGVGEGSKKLAKAMEAGGASARKGMMALGMGMEEQAGAYAQVMAQMAGPSGKLNASNAEIAARTEEYAKNLKLLSDLTGEDMKAKQEQIRQENDNLAFQQQLDGMTEQERINITESMKGMSEVQRKALRERMIYGTVISKDVAIAEATNSGLAKSNQEFANLAAEGRLNLDNTLKVQGENSDEIHKGAMANKALAQAGNAGNADAAAAARDQMKTDRLTRKLQTAATEEERKKILEQMNEGKGGKREEVGLQETQQRFAVEMEKIAAKNLPQFAKAIDTTIKDIEGSVKELAKLGINAGTQSPLLTAMAGIVSALTAIVPVLSLFAAKGGASGGISGGAKEMAKSAKSGAGDFLKSNKGSIAGMVGGLALDKGADMAKEAGHEKLGAGLGVGSAALSGASMGAMFGPMGALAGGVLGAGYGLYQNWGGLTGSKPEKTATPTGSYANGGIANGPMTGYASMLHGRELILPMKEDGGFKEGSAGMSELLKMFGANRSATSDSSSELASLFKEQLSRTEDLIRIMGDNRDITERLMRNMS